MLSNYITTAINDLDILIEYTKEDIKDAKLAKHDLVFSRRDLKEDTLSLFFLHKNELEEYMKYLLDSKNSSEMVDILSDEESILFDSFKEKLFQLKKLNKRFMKVVVMINEFYTSLLSKIFPYDMEGYNMTISNKNKFLELKG